MRCLLVDTHEIYMRGARTYLEKVMGAVCDDVLFEECVEPVPSGDGYDVAIVGLSDRDVCAAHSICTRFDGPLAGSIAVLCDTSSQRVASVAEAGFQSFVHRASPWATLRKAVERTLTGRRYVDERIAPYLLQPDRTPFEHFGLSSRESEIALLVARGLDNSSIARHLFISPNTVKYHLRGVYAKTGVTTRVQLSILMAQGPS